METEKRTKFILKALDQEHFKRDVEVREVLMSLIQRKANLGVIYEIIASYRSSLRGLKTIEAIEMTRQISQWDDWVFTTLTFNPTSWRWKVIEVGKTAETRANEAKFRVKALMDKLSKIVLPRNAYNRGIRIRYVAMTGGNGDNLHYHCLIERHSHIEQGSLDKAIKNLWCGNTDTRRYNDNIYQTCIYMLNNQDQSNGIGKDLGLNRATPLKKAS
jgi:hypothetical protein